MQRRIFLTLLLLVVAFGAFALPAAAEQQRNITWRAFYFNNPYLIGDPAIQRFESNIAFNWGTGAPEPGMPDDGWSARFAADVYFEAGRYRFDLLADDGVKLGVDFRTVLNTYNQTRPGEVVSVELDMPTGVIHVQIDFVELGGIGYLYAGWTNLDTGVTTQPFTGPAPQPVPVTPGVWTAQYFNNANLQGMPVATLTEASPNHNWGANAPLANMPGDFFSVRWTSQQSLDGGMYQITTRADDGVRVFINGVLYIDGWNGRVAEQLSALVTLPTGNHTFVVEFREDTGLAYIEFNIARPGTTPYQPPTPVPPVAPVDATATVTAWRLNVRQTPDPVNGAVLTRINRSETYPVTQRDSATGWWQIRVDGITGWVSDRWVSVSNADRVPVTSQQPTQPQPQPTQPVAGNTLTTIENLNLRMGPGVWFARMNIIPAGTAVPILARNADASWWKVQFSGQTGWVSGEYVRLAPNVDPNAVPVQSS